MFAGKTSEAKMKVPRILLVIGLVILLLASSNMPVLAKTPQVSTTGWFTNAFTTNGGDTLLNSEYVTKVVDKDGRELYRMITPVKPPKIKVPAVEVPQNSVAGALSLGNVPAFDWSYGCSATSAAMMFGYYDRTGYPAIYTGPTNGGVCPLDNSVWGHTHYPGVTCGESPISATHNGVDGRATRGHVDDYWIDYGNAGPDPYIANGWAEHSPFDSAGDFMGTNQSKYSSTDGSTSFYYDGSGAPLSDYTGSEPGDRDGCHGMRLFAESRGYAVLANYTQLIRGVGSNPALGFTFVNYCSQIDAGRPVLIQVNGHTMLGDGYNTTGNIVYLHDTWDYSDHQMTWGGSYSGMAQWGVTVLQLAPAAAAGITVASPNGGESWMLGESRAIQWSSFGVSGNVAIELSRNGGSAWEALFSSLSNDGSESWIVTAPASTTCRMRISSVSNPSIQDTSDGNFAISIPTPDTVQLTNLPQTVGIPAHLPFTLQVQASDSLGHTLTFSLLSGPGSINPSSGFFSWNDPLPGQSDVLIQAACSGGAGDQDTLTLQVTAIPPEASTGSADSLSQSAATLHGEVQPHQLATSAWFQWGLTDQYGQETGHGDAGSGNSWVSVSAPLSGLLSGQLYHCRLVAQNASGLAYGEDCSFTTVSPPPALAIGSISATPQSGVSNWSPVTIQAGANRSGNWSGTIHHPSGAQIGTLAGGSGSAYSAAWAPTATQNFCGSGYYAVVQVTSDTETKTATVSFAIENFPVKALQVSLVNEVFSPIANPHTGQVFFVRIDIRNNSSGVLSSAFAPLTINDRYIGAGGLGNIQPGQQASFFVRCGGLALGSYPGRVYVWVSLGGWALAEPVDFSLTVLP